MQDKEEAMDPLKNYQKQLDSVKKKIKNTVTAIEDGAGKAMIERLNELEAKEEELETEIAILEVKKPRLTANTIKAWLNSFRIGDMDDPIVQRRLLDTFVARVELIEGEIRVFYNVSGEGSVTAQKVDFPSWKPNTAPVVLSTGYILHYIAV